MDENRANKIHYIISRWCSLHWMTGYGYLDFALGRFDRERGCWPHQETPYRELRRQKEESVDQMVRKEVREWIVEEKVGDRFRADKDLEESEVAWRKGRRMDEVLSEEGCEAIRSAATALAELDDDALDECYTLCEKEEEYRQQVMRHLDSNDGRRGAAARQPYWFLSQILSWVMTGNLAAVSADDGRKKLAIATAAIGLAGSDNPHRLLCDYKTAKSLICNAGGEGVIAFLGFENGQGPAKEIPSHQWADLLIIDSTEWGPYVADDPVTASMIWTKVRAKREHVLACWPDADATAAKGKQADPEKTIAAQKPSDVPAGSSKPGRKPGSSPYRDKDVVLVREVWRRMREGDRADRAWVDAVEKAEGTGSSESKRRRLLKVQAIMRSAGETG